MSQIPKIPLHYNDLAVVEATIETMLSGALTGSGHAFRKPFIATIGKDGRPRSRIMILRDLDWEARTVRLHTDRRSEKVAEIKACPDVNMAFYDPGTEIQIQLSARAKVHSDDAYAKAAWTGARASSLRAYLGEAVSGTPSQTPVSGLPEDVEGIIPTRERVAEGRKNFAAIELTFHQIDWLFLSPSGNRRARFEFERDKWVGIWLVP